MSVQNIFNRTVLNVRLYIESSENHVVVPNHFMSMELINKKVNKLLQFKYIHSEISFYAYMNTIINKIRKNVNLTFLITN